MFVLALACEPVEHRRRNQYLVVRPRASPASQISSQFSSSSNARVTKHAGAMRTVRSTDEGIDRERGAVPSSRARVSRESAVCRRVESHQRAFALTTNLARK
jgi:hypothetical protein